MAAQPQVNDARAADAGMPDELHPRHLAVRVVEIAAIIALVAIAVSALPGLDEKWRAVYKANAPRGMFTPGEMRAAA